MSDRGNKRCLNCNKPWKRVDYWYDHARNKFIDDLSIYYCWWCGAASYDGVTVFRWSKTLDGMPSEVPKGFLAVDTGQEA